MEGIIAARLNTLSPEEKGLLQDAAVLGKVGWLGALAGLAGVEPWVVEQRLHGLERRELLRRERRSQVAGERQYAFRHVLVRNVAYGQLPRSARADKHRRVAQWLQQLAPDRAEDRAELLAHHWQAALEYAQAAGQVTSGLADPVRLALREAGDRAMGLNAFAAAARWYQAALDIWPPGDLDRSRLLLWLARARCYEETGGELLEEARDGLLAQSDREGAAEAERLLSFLAAGEGQGERARARAARRGLAGRSRSVGGTGRRAGQPDLGPCQQRALRAGHPGRAAGPGDGRGARAEEVPDRGAQRHRHLAAPGRRPWRHRRHGAGCRHRRTGQLARRRNGLRESREHVDHAGRPGPGVCAAGRGAPGGRALRAGQRVAMVQGRGELPGLLAGPLGGRACWRRPARRRGGGRLAALHGAHLPAGLGADPAGPRRVARRPGRRRTAVELAGRAGDPEALLPALAFHARALLANGQLEQAGARAGEPLAELSELGVLATNPDWSGRLAIVLHTMGRGDELVALATTAPMPTPWLAAATAMAAGRDEAAADIYAEVGSLPDAAYARLRAAQQHLAAGRRTEGAAQLRQATAFYRQVRATGYLRQADALVAASASPTPLRRVHRRLQKPAVPR